MAEDRGRAERLGRGGQAGRPDAGASAASLALTGRSLQGTKHATCAQAGRFGKHLAGVRIEPAKHDVRCAGLDGWHQQPIGCLPD